MAKRTVQIFWKQVERLVDRYLSKSTSANYQAIVDAVEKANKENLGQSLGVLFVDPHLQKKSKCLFDASLTEQQTLPSWKVLLDLSPAEPLLRIHPVTTIQWIRSLPDIPYPASQQDSHPFYLKRWQSFLKEIAKLPSIYILFILISQEVATRMKFLQVERRGGVVESAEDEEYHTLLWGFKQVEIFIMEHWHVSIRSYYGITWHESEWLAPAE